MCPTTLQHYLNDSVHHKKIQCTFQAIRPAQKKEYYSSSCSFSFRPLFHYRNHVTFIQCGIYYLHRLMPSNNLEKECREGRLLKLRRKVGKMKLFQESRISFSQELIEIVGKKNREDREGRWQDNMQPTNLDLPTSPSHPARTVSSHTVPARSSSIFTIVVFSFFSTE